MTSSSNLFLSPLFNLKAGGDLMLRGFTNLPLSLMLKSRWGPVDSPDEPT